MAGWDGAGNFTRAHDWTDDRDAAVKILASRHDTEDDNFATGINATLAKNGENAATGNLNLGGFRYTNAGAATARTDLPQTLQVQDRSFVYAAGGGTADVQTATLVPAITAYAGGQRFSFLPAATNTSTTPTLNVNAVGAKTVKKLGSAALVAGDIVINKVAVVEYNSDDDSWELLNPATAVQEARAINTGSGLTGGGDLSADRTLALDINGLTGETVPAIADTLAIYDDTATANRKVTLDNFYKTINGLTADATPDDAADYVVTYDADASAAKKVLLSNLDAYAAGRIIQYKQTVDTTDRSTASATFATSNVSATFDGSVVSGNVVKILVTGVVGVSAAGEGHFQLYRDTGGGDAAIANALHGYRLNNNSIAMPFSLQFIDTSPGTAATKYTLYFKTPDGITIYLGRDGANNGPNASNAPTILTIEEISQ